MKHTPLQQDGSEQPPPKANTRHNHVVNLDEVIKYIRGSNVAGSFSEGCTCELCDKYEKKVRRALIRLSQQDTSGRLTKPKRGKNATTTPVTLKKRNETE